MAQPAPVFAAVPDNARWTELKVEGMHCGGCARRVERGLAKVDGVLGVQVDLAAHTVKVATRDGIDARSIGRQISAAIDSLGYHVE
jgi:Cu+-exporting ATPase